MAYGKIKADTFVYDNSGSDVEVTLASLGSKVDANNPTFTGTVTIPTPTSGDNSTKAASTAFVVAGFASKPASAGTVAASETVQVDANKDITGFRNVTLSGDLTVNGTTTTINSTTLAVDDKNIELGTVDTPSDTTAHGGGITLKGATDKTFHWADDTDAWTSSEHVHILDNKKLLIGTGGDLEIHHDGTDTIIDASSANLFIKHGAEKNAVFINDGAAELYYDNIKTFATNSNGIIVYAPEGSNADIHLYADEGDDNADKWRIRSGVSGTFIVGNYSTGSWVDGLTLDGSNNATFAGTVSDSKGDVRSIPNNHTTTAYTLVATDAGKCVTNTTGGVTVNTSIFSAGDAVTIINHSGSDITITQGSSMTIYNTADAATGNRTLAGRGMATIYFTANNLAYISGAGLS